MKEVKALINYKDFKINKDIKKGEELVELYKQAGIELDEERIELLLKGNQSSNFKPFIEVREKMVELKAELSTEEKEVVNELVVEEASDSKPKRRSRKAKAE